MTAMKIPFAEVVLRNYAKYHRNVELVHLMWSPNQITEKSLELKAEDAMVLVVLAVMVYVLRKR